MFNSLRLMALAILAGLAATATHADGDYRGRWWRTPAVAEQMQLSEAEIRQLDNAFEAARIRMIELKGQVEVEQGKLRALMEQTDFNEAAVWEQHRRQEAARTQLADARFGFLLQVRKITGHNRFIKLLDIREEQKKKRYKEKKEEF
ncbi:MAG: periplasmic heavy metal sensor [Desulfobacteraceae bacterium]|nr:MAG: periplasmic heavy metal sensor [Desulfobacteraceae bacterium]